MHAVTIAVCYDHISIVIFKLRHPVRKNLSAFWLPEFTLQKEIGGTVYTVTGSYDGVETLDKKMERIMGEKFTEKMEDSE